MFNPISFKKLEPFTFGAAFLAIMLVLMMILIVMIINGKNKQDRLWEEYRTKCGELNGVVIAGDKNKPRCILKSIVIG